MKELSKSYPNLTRPLVWGPLTCQFELCDTPPPRDRINNVHIVPFCGDRCLLMQLESGEWEIPGGTLEPEDGYMNALRRELLEEAGARLLAFVPFGVLRCHSSAPKPYRPHLPHPDFVTVLGYGEVEIVSTPESPEGAEQVVEVRCTSVEEAIQLFLSTGRPDLAEAYQLAARIRAGGARGS